MTLTEKFATLTPEQQEQFKSIKNADQLDALLAEQKIDLSAEEKAQTIEFIEKGIIPLVDEELDNVAGGGGCGTLKCKKCNSTNVKQESFVGGGVSYYTMTCRDCGNTWNKAG